jgi:hypothetical protein
MKSMVRKYIPIVNTAAGPLLCNVEKSDLTTSPNARELKGNWTRGKIFADL